MIDEKASARICPTCGRSEPMPADQRWWPPDWRCGGCGASVGWVSGVPQLAPELADTVTGFDPVSFARLAEIEARHFWFVARRELFVGLANRFFPDARSLLEIGCGNGAVLDALVRSRRWQRAAGSDLHPTGLAFARARLPQHVEIIQMNALAIPARAAFDLIGAFDVVEHIADDEGSLRSIRCALPVGGGALISVPQHPWLWSGADDIAHHQRRYRRGEVEMKLRRNGFEVLASSSYTATLLPLLVASRIKARLRPAANDVAREVAPHASVNAALLTVLRAEIRLTLAGLRWPAGGSRVVVARAV